MKLVVVESPAKAKTIQKYLGDGYIVKSSKGHIVDLPKSGLAVDVEHDFQPEYVVTKKDVLKELKHSLAHADTLVLASDPDREGEAIGWHIARELKVINDKGKNNNKKIALQRIVFTEITKDAVQAAAANPRELDMNLVSAQQARRILDRLVGYKLSPLLWKKIRYGLSAGRVQSVAVRLIVDREREREAFKPDEYWDIKAYLHADKQGKVAVAYKLKEEEAAPEGEEEVEVVKAKVPAGAEFKLMSHKDKKIELKKQTEVKAVMEKIEKAPWLVTGTEVKQSNKYPSPPFSTSTLQQTAAGKLKFAASRTMKIAQKLYEAGLITYMRTDSLHMSSQAVDASRKFIKSEFGDKFLPATANVYKTKSKVAQEAHEAVRPTDFAKSAHQLKLEGEEARLYELIRGRALGSQMTPAVVESSTITVVVADYSFQATAKKVLFQGYLSAYPEQVTENALPKLTDGQELFPKDIIGAQHFTEPPARFSEASLIKELERLEIGRPSTYAPIIQTIQTRKYVEKVSGYFIPTDTGKVVTDLLVKYFGDIVDVGFTASMEGELDKVANGETDWVKMMHDFYNPFEKNIIKQDKKIERGEFTNLGDSDKKCPVCGKPMIVKLGRNGRFLSCSDFPTCKGIASIDGQTEADIQAKATSKEFLESYQPAPLTDDKRPFLLKYGKFGEFWAHPDYPKVKDARPLELLPAKQKELYGEPPKTDDGRPYEVKNGRFGKFWAHPDYPKVKDIVRIKKAKAAN